MPKITPANKTTIATILQNEGNPSVRAKLEHLVSIHATNGSVENVSHYVDLANYSTQKTAILAWLATLT